MPIALLDDLKIEQVQEHNRIIFIFFPSDMHLILSQKIRQSLARRKRPITMMIVAPVKRLIIFKPHKIIVALTLKTCDKLISLEPRAVEHDNIFDGLEIYLVYFFAVSVGEQDAGLVGGEIF